MNPTKLLAGLSLVAAAATAVAQTPDAGQLETAILAGGCFWCIEADYEKLDGIVDVVSGYTGGDLEDPSYKQVSAGNTGHIEAVRITYDASRIDYQGVLEHFWRNVDPTRNDGQFCDSGPQYRPAIFYLNESQKQQALASRAQIEKTKTFSEPIRVELIPASEFYEAEEYHQDYYRKNPLRYRFYRLSCGRDGRLDELWGGG